MKQAFEVQKSLADVNSRRVLEVQVQASGVHCTPSSPSTFNITAAERISASGESESIMMSTPGGKPKICQICKRPVEALPCGTHVQRNHHCCECFWDAHFAGHILHADLQPHNHCDRRKGFDSRCAISVLVRLSKVEFHTA